MIAEIEKLEGDGTGGRRGDARPRRLRAAPTAPSSPNTRLNLAARRPHRPGPRHRLRRHPPCARPARAQSARHRARDRRVGHRHTARVERLASARKVLTFSGRGDSATPVAEATARTAHQPAVRRHRQPPARIVVTSPIPGDGKSTIAANLAVSSRRGGRARRAHRRRPAPPDGGRLFGLPEGARADRRARPAAPRSTMCAHVGHRRQPRGASRPARSRRTPARCSARSACASSSQTCRACLVIIDSPPLLPVTDAAVLATSCRRRTARASRPARRHTT